MKKKQQTFTEKNDRYIPFKELVRSYVELENRLKALEENFSINDSESNQNFCKQNLFETTEKKLSYKQMWCLSYSDYGLETNRSYRYVFVLMDNFSKFGWTVPLKNKNAQTIKDSFKKIL